MSKWQPIETAPKDDDWIIIADDKKSCPAYWGPQYFGRDFAWIVFSARSECVGADMEKPTHWMPLPEPPE